MVLRDSYGRSISDLRVSLTDRCNFRCFYCLPNGEPAHACREDVLTFEEIEYLAAIFVSLGITKLRLTGGEPLIRKDVPLLVRKLSGLKPQLEDIALTTNGFDLERHAESLRRAGLDRLTVSLDSLDRQRFREMTGVDALDRVLNSITTAQDVGFSPIKVNAVIVRGRNDDEIVTLASFARERGVAVRFIEYMPLDSGHGWSKDLVVSGREIRNAIEGAFPLDLIDKTRGSSTSWRFRFADGSRGEIGIIAPVTEMFCGHCSRIRLTADGQLRTCLFSTVEHDLRSRLRSGAQRSEIVQFIEDAVEKKEPRHFINDPDFVQPARTMSLIGG